MFPGIVIAVFFFFFFSEDEGLSDFQDTLLELLGVLVQDTEHREHRVQSLGFWLCGRELEAPETCYVVELIWYCWSQLFNMGEFDFNQTAF